MKRFYTSKLIILIALLSGWSLNVFAQVSTFSYTGSVQTYSVGTGITMLGIDAKGGAGGAPYTTGYSVTASNGGRVQCTLAVTGGEVLYIYVGGLGQNDVTFTAVNGGWNGGVNSVEYNGGSGGATDIRLSPATAISGNSVGPYTATNRIVVAGGAGGGADEGGEGGLGGGPANAGTGQVRSGFSGPGGAGGTMSGPGTGGSTTGTLGVGGGATGFGGGPGGGGLYGGNGGTNDGGGGGGSSYTDPILCSAVTHTQGYSGANGNGQVVITVLCNAPGTITGTKTMCKGATTALADGTAVSGGTWSSSNTSVATINPSSGVVSGVFPGTSVITYTIPNPCGGIVATATVTVNPIPLPIGGTPNVCVGAITILTETPPPVPAGTWSTGSSLASVDIFGNVSGNGIGVATISYTLPGGCFVTQQVTVNSAPGPITGTASVCAGSVTPLSDAIGGGTWISSISGIAGVDAFGNVTGQAGPGGQANITYTLPTGCSISKIVTVNPLPAAFVMTGGNPYCAGMPFTTDIGLNSSATGVSYQLFEGPAPSGTPLAGTTGVPLNFGLPPSAGVYTATGTNTTTGCVNNMTLSATVTIKPLPVPFTVMELSGSSICQGSGTGIVISLNGSATSVNYQLYQSGSPVLGSSIIGTGSAINFAPEFTGGSYTVVATTTGAAPACSNTMTGSAAITINALPDINNITGGGAFCAGGAGVPIGLDFTSTGISYQLFNGGTPAGSPVLGSGGSISFGFQTAVGSTYEVIATNTTTECTSTMNGTASVSIAPALTQYDVTGGGPGCAGTSFPVGLDGSDAGVNYQLYNNGIPVGGAVPGISGPFNFGSFSDAGVYKVIATDQTYFCTSNMNDSAIIVENTLPVVFNVTGGGNFCAGGTGVPVILSGSQSGVTYSLSTGGAVINTVTGTGGALNLGTYSAAGSYTVAATAPNTCSSNMAGAAIISVSPLPIAFTVTASGTAYCAGGTGIDLGLSFSASGVNYQLYNTGILSGSVVPGTGDVLDFGLHTAPGTYTVVGTNSGTGCIANMLSSASITINPLPDPHTVTGGGSYCTGNAGQPVSIGGSNTGIAYQLYNNGITPIDTPVNGTGGIINFGLQTLAGAYTVIAANTATGCTTAMPGSATIVVNTSPTVFTVTGGGLFCGGSEGMHIGLTGSNAGIHYLLYDSSALQGTFTGTGAPLDFGSETITGNYTVVAANTATGCSSNMDGNAVIATNAAPTAYSVIGGGSYCSGTTALPSVGLSSSDAGISYQLFNGGAAVAGGITGGTGAAIDFGPQASAGSYTIVATDGTNGCTKNMTGSATVAINPLPAVSTVIGGGSYCAGGTGEHILMGISTTGIRYILYNGSIAIDTVTGTGAGVDFGLQAAAGTYTAIAVNPVTGCTSNMAGSAAIIVNSLPAAHAVTVADGGNYCVTASGVHVGIDGSNTGINYQLYNGPTATGAVIGGTGLTIDFGLHTAGSYTVVAINAATGCISNMTGSALVNAIPLPNTYTLTGGGNYCSTGLGLHIGLSGSDAGTQYQLYHGATAIGIPVTGAGGGAAVDFGEFTGAGTYTVVATNGGATGCNGTMSGTAVISVYPVVIPAVAIAAAGGDTACIGNTTNFTASSINGGTSPAYSWSVNGAAVTASGSAFSYMPTDGDMVTVLVHSNGICAIPDTASQTIRMTVSLPELPSAHVTATPGDVVCQGAPVTFTATALYGGPHPVYNWIKNSTTIVGTGLTYSYTPANGDIIVLMVGSDFPCRLADTAYSNTHTIAVDQPVIPTLTISANPGTQIAVGESVTLTAHVVNPGSAPVYQWLVNGAAIPGATGTSFTSNTLSDNDSVTCEVTGGCDLQGFNSLRIHTSTEGVAQVTAAGSDIKLVPNPNKGAFTIKGTLPVAGNEEVSIAVTDMLGQVIYSSKVIAQNGVINEKIQLSSSLSNGMYILNLRSGSQDNVFHFVIEQ